MISAQEAANLCAISTKKRHELYKEIIEVIYERVGTSASAGCT